MDLGLSGRVAMVAGASSGLGYAVAEQLAAEGARVSIASRSAERIAEARRTLATAGSSDVLGVVADVRETDAVVDWVARTVEEFGGVDVVVANSGGPPPGPATAFGVDDYREALELNLLSSIRLVQAALPHIRRSSQGRVLFITSITVKQPIAALALSNTARPGVVGYAKSLVGDLAGTGVTVNVLAPGLTRTARLEQLTGDDPAAWNAMAADIPLGRLGEPEEFAAVAAFLAGARASFVTGAVIPIDGGATRGLL